MLIKVNKLKKIEVMKEKQLKDDEDTKEMKETHSIQENFHSFERSLKSKILLTKMIFLLFKINP